jgi:phage-related minor tail protein
VAASATVAREKLLLARIKQVQASIEEAAEAAKREATGSETGSAISTAEDGANVAPPVTAAEPLAGTPSPPQQASYDRGLEFLKGRLNRMLNVIEADVAHASQVRVCATFRPPSACACACITPPHLRVQGLGHALRVADSDKDGEVTEAELRAALGRLVGGGELSEEAAAALIRRLDRDGDGAVTVESLERYIDRFSAVLARAAEREAAAKGPQQ